MGHAGRDGSSVAGARATGVLGRVASEGLGPRGPHAGVVPAALVVAGRAVAVTKAAAEALP